ncbi:prepilin peptidase [bacterium]|jgi:prepilin signal peptidase PulO-like enzyme (type II secretory pathway)|nr:prepilin peptidase [bacterium]MBT6831945.1 prepilin peptidase [bacterium]MBT6996641.1 prepilin peptidase [bacterium]MBT7773061.1 prepilin peptidase [bacterium]
MTETFFIICAVVAGTLFGSFATLLVWRLHFDEKGIFFGRSRCPQCRKILSAIELIPVFSWFLQKGRCKKCGKKIPIFYPITEIIFAATFGIFAVKFGGTENFWPMIFAAFFALLLWIYDFKFSEVDRRISFPAIAIAIGWAFFRDGTEIFLIGGAIGTGFFAIQYFASRGKWVGLGDLELGALMGFLLGWKLLLGALFLAYILGTFWAIPLLILKKATGKTPLPLGAFLMPALLVFLHSGDKIVNWYFGFLGW